MRPKMAKKLQKQVKIDPKIHKTVKTVKNYQINEQSSQNRLIFLQTGQNSSKEAQLTKFSLIKPNPNIARIYPEWPKMIV